ncbi:porin [Sphingomonas sp. SORGH_AS_0879]|uniref:porin n=1 Tax=Sphingomonas sp. SORGH_AS_0879 TaxID=3041790 RepID=UPI002786E815|nr:porin [Sphingomonas sp. SORGH_AS_0879]MDQ1231628.1 phosphate-selective porin OprO/OprP [Sphingomonas sp. SORGH_AS_0879]
MYRGAMLAMGLCAAMPVAAQSREDDVARLTRLVEQQQAQITRLEARLAAMEGQKVAATPTPLGQPLASEAHPAPPPQVAGQTVSPPRLPFPLGQALPSDAHPPSLDARLARIEKAQKDGVHVDWSKGTPEFTSTDGKFSFRPRGRILIDLGTTMGSDVAARNITATQARSLRLGFEGSVGQHLSYLLEGDFADNEIAIKSAYLAWTTGFMGQQAEFALGNRLNDRGLDGSSGTISVPFLERNFVGQGIIPVRGFFGLGAAARIYGDGWHVGVQVSGDDINNPGTAGDGLTIGARAHWNPVKTADWLLHLGVWGFHEDLATDVARPTRAIAVGGFFNDNLRISAGSFANARSGDGYGFELGAFHKSLWAYGEYGSRTLRNVTGSTDQNAWAVQGGWFLTGETPPYLTRGGVWSRPRVLRPFTSGGSGAVELATRYEELDYSDNPTAGRGTALTLGVNWYLNNFVRLQLNAIDWSVANPVAGRLAKDHGQTLIGRAQIAF